jgi:hypothetical protein
MEPYNVIMHKLQEILNLIKCQSSECKCQSSECKDTANKQEILRLLDQAITNINDGSQFAHVACRGVIEAVRLLVK